MTAEEVLSQVSKKFPSIQKAEPGVKGYLTLKLASASDLVPVVSWLKEALGFCYLDMATATDLSGPTDMRGFVSDPNPNVFQPGGPASQVDVPMKNPGFNYRDAFDVAYLLSNLEAKIKVFLKVEVPRSDPRVPSLTPLFKAADWQEREAFDLLGVRFEGHPDPRKILTPDFIQGHPLRKDYVHVKDRFD